MLYIVCGMLYTLFCCFRRGFPQHTTYKIQHTKNYFYCWVAEFLGDHV